MKHWASNVDEFRRLELEGLREGHDISQTDHRAVLASYVAEGEWLLFHADQANAKFDGFTREDVRATLDSLRLTDHLTYEGEAPSPQMKERVEALFA